MDTESVDEYKGSIMSAEAIATSSRSGLSGFGTVRITRGSGAGHAWPGEDCLSPTVAPVGASFAGRQAGTTTESRRGRVVPGTFVSFVGTKENHLLLFGQKVRTNFVIISNMTSDDIYEDIYKIHTDQLHLDGVVTNQNPSFVVFSAIPGSGKSELSRKLEGDYGYLLVTNKLIRESIAQSGHKGVVIGDYTVWFLNKLTETFRPNVVFDRNIDQWYAPSKNWANEHDYRYVMVSINVSMEILNKRLFHREGTMNSKAHEVLDFYNNQHTEIRNYIKATLYLNDNYDIDAAAKSIANA